MPRSRFLFVMLLLLSVIGCESAADPLPLLPTAAPTAAPLPAPATGTPLPSRTAAPSPAVATPDPLLDSWTLLVYMAADNGLSGAAQVALDRLTDRALPAGVNLLIQIDGRQDGDSRRLQLSQDATLLTAATDPAAGIGETNTGAGAALSDFLRWGVDVAPANRYALLLWGPGAGWAGGLHDETDDDLLTLSELDGALQEGLEGLPTGQLDLLFLPGSLAGQLDVLAAVAPHARHAVVPPGLFAAPTDPLLLLLDGTLAAPDQDGAGLARRLVDEVAPHPLAAYDLAGVAGVADALAVLTVALQRTPELSAPSVAEARAAARPDSSAAAQMMPGLTGVDVQRLALILSRRAADAPVRAAAQRLLTELQRLMAVDGSAIGSSAPHIYFPRDATLLAPDYAAAAAVPAWASYLPIYYADRETSLPEPAVQFITMGTLTVTLENPVPLPFELTGAGLVAVEQLLQAAGDGAAPGPLLSVTPWEPTPLVLSDGTVLSGWRDGLHDEALAWLPEGIWLSDGANGTFVVARPVSGGQQRLVAGQILPAGGGPPLPGFLALDENTRGVAAAWGLQAWGQYETAFRWPTAPGDAFQVDELFFVDGVVERRPGTRFLLGGAALGFQWRPLPPGDYQLRLAVLNGAGQRAGAAQPVAVGDTVATPGFKRFLVPRLDTSFLVPGEWASPRQDPTRCGALLSALCTASPDGETRLYVYSYPDLTSGVGAAVLQAQTLQDFGDVTVRYEDQVLLPDGGTALRTAYSYQSGQGARTGVFAAFLVDGVGYVVDFDGPAADETTTVALSTVLLESWERLPSAVVEGAWTRSVRAGCAVAHPQEYAFRESGGWCIFNGGGGRFLALRADPRQDGEQVDGVLQRWLATTSDQSGFTAEPDRRLVVDGYGWQRVDFTWQDGDEVVAGFIMVALIDGAWVVAWAEAPAAEAATVERDVYRVMIAAFR